MATFSGMSFNKNQAGLPEAGENELTASVGDPFVCLKINA
jgi:hypothetical protein